jgi:DNA modification methylase
VLKFFTSDSVDLVVTSPPYDNLRNYNGYTFKYQAVARELFNVMKPGGVVVWVVGDATINGSETGNSFRQALYFMECGFRLHDTMIYRKDNFIPLTHKRYEQEFEYMFCFSKGAPKTFNPIMIETRTNGAQNLQRKGYGFKEGAFRRRDEVVAIKETKQHGNIFSYSCGASGVNHPAVFSEDLARDQILSWSNPNDLVLDPFSGSGTVAKVSKEYGRHYIGIEISDEYCIASRRRIARANVPLMVTA